MTTYIRSGCAIASVLILTACAAIHPDARPSAAASAPIAQNRDCVSQTASRIPAKDSDCSAFGRSYSSEDIARTGATTADQALRLMDPSITVHR
jgi:hypothetical protein